MICLGSRPTVGSSRITTSGSPKRAWAMPTRCWYPLERSLMSRWDTSAIRVTSMTWWICPSKSSLATPLA